ncbi:MAG: UDP-N-acetylmuramoyl-L-alanine--D-glutamate ligase [Planctomycetes bacterium]|nr:UDP-N-acetylmuramoyl-L-alanine--D-glutamate ligase [Planctomycetota bacterium]
MRIDPTGKNITVMGLGRFGGGVGVSRWLVGQGAKVTITDLLAESELADSLEQISDLVEAGSIKLRLGEHIETDFTCCDLVIANPAVPKPWENKFLQAATKANIPITTEIRLLVEQLDRSHTIAITGTAGKSTTSAMIHHILSHCKLKSHFGGNIGGSLLNELDNIKPNDWIILELSSAMLYWLGEDVGYKGAAGWSPHIAALTNIQENHLDWHGSFAHYQQCKQNIFAYQQSGDHAIKGDDLKPADELIKLSIPGAHNQSNAQLAVATICAATDINKIDAINSLNSFTGLPHRLQLVASHNGQRFYNDSKSTTPNSTVLAVESFDEPEKIHLIAGGYDKGSDLSPIAAISTKIAGLYTVGSTGKQLANNANAPHREFCQTLENAVTCALKRMGQNDILLLSPGCASWDQFDNYQMRGEAFYKLINKHSYSLNLTN